MSRTSDQSAPSAPRLWTVGHSTRTFDELLAILASPEAGSIELLADVRTVPRSRRHPHFAQDALADALPRHGLRYVHLPALGGFRRPLPDSPNAAWRNGSFRGYADYMQTAPFEAALDQLLALTSTARTAIMCSEAVPWRCHRSLVADALTARGIPVAHLMSPTKAQPHTLTSFARIEGRRVTYPPPDPEPEDDEGAR